MKFFTAILLSVLLLSNNFKIVAVYGWYTLNIDNFIEQLCENKDKPQLECNGKCYLSKIIAETSKEKNPSSVVLEWEQLIFCQVTVPQESACIPTFKRKSNFRYTLYYNFKNTSKIFNPPRYS
jgi:hypothetical protein